MRPEVTSHGLTLFGAIEVIGSEIEDGKVNAAILVWVDLDDNVGVRATYRNLLEDVRPSDVLSCALTAAIDSVKRGHSKQVIHPEPEA